MILYVIKSLFERLWIWIRRFPYRCGYGVHSPTDFFLITSVIYEKLPYYAYKELAVRDFEHMAPHYDQKVNRLLFRLVNHYRPCTLLEVGVGNGSSFAYMKAARSSMKAMAIDDTILSDGLVGLRKALKTLGKVDFLHIGFTLNFREVFHEVYPYLHSESCVIVSFIYETGEKEAWWKEILADERVRITFDLHSIGILLLDEKRQKQNYIVNFF